MKVFKNYIFPFNALVCLTGIFLVAYTMTILGWKPCPMCLLQQLCVLCIFILSILGWIKKSSKNFSIIVNIVIIAIIILGIYVAADQVYIQYFQTVTTTAPGTCGGIDNPFLLDATKSITGTVESCTDITEKISGVSLAVYSLIFFISMLIINCISLLIRILKK
ncbi:dihydrofolate synthase [Candidatus Francisella endociliophora]|uniref:Dihydrofolate synthase n=1 Tax=Candidatus Francisella endociliophora TaxID=653937 RepID=A0A097EPH3_9GAMM|nr:disulfide bond formation protein B [Francisella sp. FSC1006]AIT09441.1 dihydrofolate synthase [Francisella sp. FSC1006]